MADEPQPGALSGLEPQAPAQPGSEPQSPALSQWLQLMLAEIAARREALECARTEEARRRAERAAHSR